MGWRAPVFGIVAPSSRATVGVVVHPKKKQLSRKGAKAQRRKGAKAQRRKGAKAQRFFNQ
jgi:hypothetical protein